MRFIDLFAGLGGFHIALSRLGHDCVFASEIDPELAQLYEANFGFRPAGDIRKSFQDVPKHDILCAGFPCQPFSKAGTQDGFACPQWGDLFDYVLKILDRRKPRFLIIENVPNLMRHDGGATWDRICRRLRRQQYDIRTTRLSPHMFGVPQIRDRAIIVGARDGLADFEWPSPGYTTEELSIATVLDESPQDAKALPPTLKQCLAEWQKLLDRLPTTENISTFPLWAMEFGATYPIQPVTPIRRGLSTLKGYRGAFGSSLRRVSEDDILDALPPYARDHSREFPRWKIRFIEQNRAFYQRNRRMIDNWLPSIRPFAPSYQKLEWNWKNGRRDIWRTLIQFRASGIRAKQPTVAPSLVALTTSQIPVVAWQGRYMTMRECARLQSMNQLRYLPPSKSAACKALGNAVNVDVMFAVAKALLGATETKRRRAAEPSVAPRTKPSEGTINRRERDWLSG